MLANTVVVAAPSSGEGAKSVWYLWFLSRWSTNEVTCQFYVPHAGLPTVEEVSQSCGDTLAREWQSTPICSTGENCTGVYLHTVGQSSLAEIKANLSGMLTVWLELKDCEFYDGGNLCDSKPVLVFRAEQPADGQLNLSVEGKMANADFSCASAVCERDLGVTPPSGIDISFWSVTADGEKSQRFTARVRVVETTKDDSIPGPYRVDILSAQWRGDALPACAETWQAFPPVSGVPDWLSTPESASALATDAPLSILAGKLITWGVVDAGFCPANGLLANGAANSCGLEAARPFVTIYQNQFDVEIWSAAQRLNVPAWLVKYLFMQETQFWSSSHGSFGEHGLGQISELGADTLLLWSPEFYWGFCSDVLSPLACANGYLGLAAESQALLRGAVLQSLDTACVGCEQGVDWELARASVPVFVQSIKANCEQVGQIVRNVTHQPAGLASDYESLWRITLANYNVGSGCIGDAVTVAWKKYQRLDWPTVAASLSPYCAGGINYVQQIEP